MIIQNTYDHPEYTSGVWIVGKVRSNSSAEFSIKIKARKDLRGCSIVFLSVLDTLSPESSGAPNTAVNATELWDSSNKEFIISGITIDATNPLDPVGGCLIDYMIFVSKKDFIPLHIITGSQTSLSDLTIKKPDVIQNNYSLPNSEPGTWFGGRVKTVSSGADKGKFKIELPADRDIKKYLVNIFAQISFSKQVYWNEYYNDSNRRFVIEGACVDYITGLAVGDVVLSYLFFIAKDTFDRIGNMDINTTDAYPYSFPEKINLNRG